MCWISSQFFNIISFVVFVQFQQWEVYLHARPRQSGTCTSFDRPPQCSLARTPRPIHKLLQMLLFVLFVIPSLQLLSNTTPNLPAWIKCSLVLKTLINLPLSKLSVKLMFIGWSKYKALYKSLWSTLADEASLISRPAPRQLSRNCLAAFRPSVLAVALVALQFSGWF